jgi:hypothetical protein
VVEELEVVVLHKVLVMVVQVVVEVEVVVQPHQLVQETHLPLVHLKETMVE